MFRTTKLVPRHQLLEAAMKRNNSLKGEKSTALPDEEASSNGIRRSELALIQAT